MLFCWGRGTCDIDFEGLGMQPGRACMDKLHDAAYHLVIQPSCQPALQEAHMHQGPREHPVVAPHWWMCHPPHLQADHPVILQADDPVVLRADDPVVLRADDPVVLQADVWLLCSGQKHQTKSLYGMFIFLAASAHL